MIYRSQIRKILSDIYPSYSEFLKSLVSIPSQHGTEAQCQLLVERKILSLGYQVEKVYSRNDTNSINLATRIKGGSTRSLVLNAHVDVTPHDGNWDFPPYSATIKDGILYGKGAQDDKAGIAVIVMVAECIKNLNIKLNGDLILQVVVDDEISGDGSKALIQAGYGGDGVIICDGTWPERIIYGHLGQLWLDVSITGVAVAACVEHKGINPIYLGMKLIDQLRKWAKEMNSSTALFEQVEKPFFVNIGSFHSGVWYGSVPEHAAIQIQIGFGESLQPNDIIDIMRGIAKKISDRIDIKKGSLATPAFKTDPSGLLIQGLKSVIERNRRKPVILQSVRGHCDMRHFDTNNICLYGPGAGWNAHAPNESYRLSDMPIVATNLVEFALAWCGVS